MAKQPDADKAPEEKPADATPVAPKSKPHCGIIMPLSDTVGYDPGHWGQVQTLIIRAAEKAGFTASMVSTNQAEDMIHTSIVRNIYQNDVVVCDVSSLNANVMLELGLRMATLLPLVIIFDGEKDYPFDIKQMIREGYPRSLHIFKVESFVDALSEKIKQVYEAQQRKEYQPFLSHFKEVKIEPAKLGSETQSIDEVLQTLVSQVNSIRRDMKTIQIYQSDNDLFTDSEIGVQSLSMAEQSIIIESVTRHKKNLFERTQKVDDISSAIYNDVINKIFANKLITATKVRAIKVYIDYCVRMQLASLTSTAVTSI